MTELARQSELLTTLEEGSVLANFDAFLQQFSDLNDASDKAVGFALLSTIAKRAGDKAEQLRKELLPAFQESFDSGSAVLTYHGVGESEEAVRLVISQRNTLSFDAAKTQKVLDDLGVPLARAGKVTYEVNVERLRDFLNEHGFSEEDFIKPVLAPDKKKVEALVTAGVIEADALLSAVTVKSSLAVRKKFGSRLQFALGVSAESDEE